MDKRIRAIARTAVVVVALAGCTSGGGGTTTIPTSGGSPRVSIAFVTHQTPGDTFWDLVRRGAEAAAAKDDIDLQYSHDPDAAGQANLVRSAVDAKVAGIAVTFSVPSVMAPAIQFANAAKIPVVALNSGIADWKAMGVLEYFGQDEMIAGEAVGERFSNEGAQNALCVIHEPGHVGLEARCAGVAKGFSGNTQKLYVNGVDESTVKAAVIAKLQQDFSIDRILTLGAPTASAALEAVGEANSYARVDTFDTNSAVVDAIKNGMIDWAIDQQPFLQGYLAVDSLWLYLTNGNVIGGGVPTLTGPSFVDETNIDTVADLAEAGTR
ncbi:MAG: simple sugar transport system substrate-binding protein [Mycobacterium sp.]|nr:simple sugar transport system substrate-binding protein [Mycobacterium sp.]